MAILTQLLLWGLRVPGQGPQSPPLCRHRTLLGVHSDGKGMTGASVMSIQRSGKDCKDGHGKGFGNLKKKRSLLARLGVQQGLALFYPADSWPSTAWQQSCIFSIGYSILPPCTRTFLPAPATRISGDRGSVSGSGHFLGHHIDSWGLNANHVFILLGDSDLFGRAWWASDIEDLNAT